MHAQDWCISRQLWWGHRIPVWYVYSSEAEADAAPKAGGEAYVVARCEADAYALAREAHPHMVSALVGGSVRSWAFAYVT